MRKIRIRTSQALALRVRASAPSQFHPLRFYSLERQEQIARQFDVQTLAISFLGGKMETPDPGQTEVGRLQERILYWTGT